MRIDAEYCESCHYSIGKPGFIGLIIYLAGNAGHNGGITTPIVMSADSQWAATGSSDGTIIIWDLQHRCVSQERFAEYTEPRSLAFSPDGRYIVSIGDRSWRIRVTPRIKPDDVNEHECAVVWDLHEGGRKVSSLEGECDYDWYPNNPSGNCIWSPNGTWIAAGVPSLDVTYIWETTTFQRLHPASTWKGSELLASSADGRWVVTAHHRRLGSTRPTTVWIWSVESGELHQSLRGHVGSVYAAFNLESTHIATGSRDSTIRIWDAQTGEQLLILGEERERSRTQIDAVAFSGDGRMLLSHSSKTTHQNDDKDGSDAVRVWDASNGTLLVSLSETRLAGQHIVRSACFSPCGSYLVSSSDDKGVLLWRISDWSCVAELSARGEVVIRVAISPDGRVLCYGTEAGRVFFHRMHDLVSASQD